MARDRRHVSEPVLPAHVCATLAPVGGVDPVKDTSRLQAAIDSCPMGEAVRLTGGRLVSGPLIVKSGVTLWVDRGAVLVASTDPLAYDKDGHCGNIDDRGNGCRPFLLFNDTQGGGIVGGGMIDGQGGQLIAGHQETWWQLARRAQAEGGKQNVPRLIEIDHARDITFYRITLRNAPNFHVAMDGVQGATFWDVHIDTPADARNTDGIDPVSSQDVTIAHSFIRTGDDNVAIKAGKGGASAHVSLIDDHFYWGHGLSIGSETTGGVSDILVQGLTLDGTTSGLRIKSDASRGGLVHDIHYEHICLRNNRRPLDFDTHYDVSARGNQIPVYRNIVLHDVVGTSGDLVLYGFDVAHPLSVTLDGVRFSMDAHWRVGFAQVRIGSGGAFPALPGNVAGAGVYTGCDRHWVPFPVRAGEPDTVAPAVHVTTGDIAMYPAASVRTLQVGTGQTYTTVQAAADAARPGDMLLIAPGHYHEVVHLRVPGVRLVGQGASADAVVIEADHSAGDSGGTAHSATVFAEADGIEIDRMTIANRFHDEHPEVTDRAQAIALSATGDHQRFIGLHLIGYQDTLYAGSRGCNDPGNCRPVRQYYQDSRIDGAVDVIFGDAMAFFERTELHGGARAQVTLTAQGRLSPNNPGGYTFHNCKVTADPAVTSISLGRPWRDYATVSYVGCWLDGRVRPEGFTEWQGEHRLATARYLIADARGPGANAGPREPWLLRADAAMLMSLDTPRLFFKGNAK